MAQQEVGTLLYYVQTDADKHIDLSVGLGIGNYKQFHQFSSSGRPLCYRATIECLVGAAVPLATAAKSYPVVNSLVQTCAGWNSQRRRAGQKKSDMSPYGQRFRVGLTDDSVDNDGALSQWIEPYTSPTYTDTALVTLFATTTNEAGTPVRYQHIGEVTTMVVPGDQASDEPSEEPAVILSGAASDSITRFRTVREWTQNRQGTAVEPDEGREIKTSNKMARLFSDAQPETDEILVELDEYQEFRPYDQDAQYHYQNWGSIAKNTGAGERSIVTVEAPCGLIQLGDLGTDQTSSTKAGDMFLVTVHAIYEM